MTSPGSPPLALTHIEQGSHRASRYAPRGAGSRFEYSECMRRFINALRQELMNCAARRCTIALVHVMAILDSCSDQATSGFCRVWPGISRPRWLRWGNMTIMLKPRVIPASDVSNTQSRRGETLSSSHSDERITPETIVPKPPADRLSRADTIGHDA